MLLERKTYVESILNKINECSIKGLDALYKNNLKTVGLLMYENHELLKLLGVSSEKLDKVVELSKKNNVHGAKLSGGGGGGIAVALLDKYNKAFEDELMHEGFICIKADISEEGAKDNINNN